MKNLRKTLALALLSWGIMGDNAPAAITIDTVPVLNPGNANDLTGYGAVGYNYSLGTYEVTLNQYATFLNAVAATDTYSLYNANMAANVNIAGITQSGAPGSYTYSVTGSGNRPGTYVSWFDAARFVNWLENGQPTGAQNASTTEQGSYTLNGATSGIFTRNAGMTFALPTENEWYKGAYHQPTAQGGDADNYWLYPMSSNAQPNSRNGSASDPNSANFYYNDGIANGYNGGYAVNNSTINPGTSTITDVGVFSVADSFYGTYDQGGNVWEWNDAVIGPSRGLRGGAWDPSSGTGSLRATSRNSNSPESESAYVGFRILAIPEPGVLSLLALGAVLVAWQRKRAG
jgi:formylglycine-generating enzyme